MVMINNIKELYSKFSGGKSITSNEYILKKNHFSSILFDRFVIELEKYKIQWNGNDISFENLINNELSTNTKIKLNNY